jgi:hypothetical protein
VSAPAYIAGSAAEVLQRHLPPDAFREYMEKVLKDAGETSDPVEKMILEQITLAHHNIGRLFIRSAQDESPAQAKIYQDAATRLLGEFRQLVLALKKYRETTSSKNFVVVKQQNLAAGNQQVAFVDRNPSDGEERDASGQNAGDGDPKRIRYAPQEDVIPRTTLRRQQDAPAAHVGKERD